MTKSKRKKASPKAVKVGSKSYKALSLEEQEEKFAEMEDLTVEEVQMNLEMIRLIKARLTEDFPVKYNEKVYFILRRITDGDYNKLIGKYMDVLPKLEQLNAADGTLSEGETMRLNKFIDELCAESIHRPLVFKGKPEKLSLLDKGLKIALQTEAMRINIIDLAPKN